MSQGDKQLMVPEDDGSQVVVELPGTVGEPCGVLAVGDIETIERFEETIGDREDMLFVIHGRDAACRIIGLPFDPLLDGFSLVWFQNVDFAISDIEALAAECTATIVVEVDALEDEVSQSGFRATDIVPGHTAVVPVEEHIAPCE